MNCKEIGRIIFDPPIKTKKHQKQDVWKNTVLIQLSGEVCAYYRWMIEKRFGIKLLKSIRGPHMTFINDRISEGEQDKYYKTKKKWQGKRVEVTYDINRIETDGKHWWISAYSEVAPIIRKECGNNPKYIYGFHITIGKVNEKDLIKMPYIMKNLKRYEQF